MSWLVDTNILSELRKGDRANEDSVLLLGEIRRAIESIRRRDVSSALALEQWLTRLTMSFGDRVLSIDA